MERELFQITFVFLLISCVLLSVSEAYDIYDISGDWIVEHTEEHNSWHEVYKEYNPDGSIAFVEEYEIVDEDVPDSGVTSGNATQDGTTIHGYIKAEDPEQWYSEFNGSISGDKVVFTLITEGENENYPGKYIWICSDLITHFEGTYDPVSNTITGTYEGSQEEDYQEYWFPGDHYSYYSTEITYSGIFTITVEGSGGGGGGGGGGPAVKLAFLVSPEATPAWSNLEPNPEVAVQNAFGNIVTSSTASITVEIKEGTGTDGAALSGTLTLNAVNGVAAFDDLSIDKQGEGYQLTAASFGLTPADCNEFDITPGPVGDFCGAGSDLPDGYVDYWDLLCFAQCWHCRLGDPCWDDPLKCSKCDLSGPNGKPDGYIDYWDLLVFAQQWHKGEPP